MNYNNFKLKIKDSSENNYLIEAESYTGAEDSVNLSLSLSDDELKSLESIADEKFGDDFLVNFSQIIEERIDCLRLKNEKTCEDFLKKYGELLYKRLFNENVRDLYHTSYGPFEQKSKKGMRIDLSIHSPKVAALPWELLYNQRKGCFIATSEKTPLIRYIKSSTSIRDIKVKPPVNVLVIIPKDTGLDVEREKQIICEAFNNATGAEIFNVEFLEGEVTETSISDKLLLKDYHILHFTGHAVFTDDQGFLQINKDSSAEDPYLNEGFLSADAFSSMISNSETINLIVLNACQGAKTSQVEPFKGIAEKLIKQVPAVVAMQYSIDDPAAILFAREFYFSLCKGQNRGKVDCSISHARNRLYTKFINASNASPLSFAAPVLYLRSPKGTIFDFTKYDSAFRADRSYVEERKNVKSVYEYENEILIEEKIKAPPEQIPEIDEKIKKNEEESQRIESEIQKWRWTFAATVVAGFIAFSAVWFSLFSLSDFYLEKKIAGFLDLFISKELHDDIRIVLIDEEKYGEELEINSPSSPKWRSEVYAKLIKKLSEPGKNKAKMIVFDIVLSGDSEPLTIDESLAKAITDAEGNKTKIIFGCFNYSNEKVSDAIPPQKLEGIIREENCGIIDATQEPEIIFSTVDNYKPAEIPKLEPFGSRKKIQEASLALRSVLEANKLEAYYNADENSIQFEKLGDDSILVPEIPLHSDQKILIDFLRYEQLENPLVRNDFYPILNGGNISNLGGKIVFIGTTDKHEVIENLINGDKRYGVEYHANVASNILQGKYIRQMEGTLSSLAVMVLMLMLGILLQTRLRWVLDKFTVPIKIEKFFINIDFHIPLLLILIPLLYLLVMAFIYVESRMLFDMSYHIFAFFFGYFTGWVLRQTVSTKFIQAG